MSQQTKNAIRTSFIKLLNERAFDKISVKDIVEDCNINRNTFYYHYQDIFDLLEDVLSTETEKVLSNRPPMQSWLEDFTVTMEFALKNKKAIQHLKNSRHRDELNRYCLKLVEDIMLRFVRQQAQGMGASDEDVKLIAKFYKHGIVGILFEWMENDMNKDWEDVIYRIGLLMDGTIYTALKNAEDTRLREVTLIQ